MENRTKTVIVLGMHRSGTSMLAGALSRLGIKMGERLLTRMWSNPFGHFEDEEFLVLNHRILKEAGGSWDNPPIRDSIYAQKNKFETEIRDLLRTKNKCELWGWKDPRTVLTIDLYLPYLINPHIIVSHRDEQSIVNSLQRRNKMTEESIRELIEIYQSRIETFLNRHPDLPVLHIFYEHFLESPETMVQRIIKFLELEQNKENYLRAASIVRPNDEMRKLSNFMRVQSKVKQFFRRPAKRLYHFFKKTSKGNGYMCNMNRLNGPVVIGGVEGSGTRVIAEILTKLGFYLGNDLNLSKDNLWFTLLFKRPKWYQSSCVNKAEVFRSLRILSHAMIERGFLHPYDVRFILHEVLCTIPEERKCIGRPKMLQQIFLVAKMITSINGIDPKYIGWGWKEPNSHIYLNYMAECFENFKYIHTIRNGLDMAFSKNQQQLFNWAALFGVEIPEAKEDIPRSSLKYWIKANQRAIEIGNLLGPKKFLIVNFDKLCVSPSSEIEKIMSFLEINSESGVIANLAKIPCVPSSVGRYKIKDLSVLDCSDMKAVQRFGFSIDV